MSGRRDIAEVRDIVVTWPKSRPLASYFVELEHAKAYGLTVCFRVPRVPPWPLGAFDYGAPEVRCYRVHNGFVRGWLRVLGAEWHEFGRVRRVGPGSESGGFWPEGNYIVCDPEWHSLDYHPQMEGFRGWRWYERSEQE